jgi:DNA-binding MarR family transcriptional regulator
MLRVHAALVRELDKELAEAEGLGLSAYEVLLYLAEAPHKRLRMKDLADSLLVSRSGLTGIVGELERRGYVTRERLTDDRRGIDAVLTRAGQVAFRRVHRVHLAGVRARFLQPLSAQQLQQLAGAWAAIDRASEPDVPVRAGGS